MPVAKEVIFEPLSTSDWELIEMEASILEDGGLLNQITVVYPGQVLPLRLISSTNGNSFGRLETAAWVKVKGDDDESIYSDSDSESSLSHDGKGSESSVRCLQLMAETEVIVIPKPRVKELTQKTDTIDQPVNIPSKPLRVQLTAFDCGCFSPDLNVASHLPSPQVGNVYIHPMMASELPGYQFGSMPNFDTVIIRRTRNPCHYSFKNNMSGFEESSDVSIAKINFDDKVKKGHIGEQI